MMMTMCLIFPSPVASAEPEAPAPAWVGGATGRAAGGKPLNAPAAAGRPALPAAAISSAVADAITGEAASSASAAASRRRVIMGRLER